MKYNLTEQKALKKLKIPDFRYMTKDKIVQFMAMAPHMDPAVVRAAIDKFPEFKDMAIQMADTLKEMVDKAFASDNESQAYFYNSCNRMLDILEKELDDENIDDHERELIREQMMQVLSWIGQKDSEHKHFILSVVRNITMGVGVLAASAVALLGVTVALPSSEVDSDSNVDETIEI